MGIPRAVKSANQRRRRALYRALKAQGLPLPTRHRNPKPHQWRPSARNRADCPAINDGPLLHIGEPVAIRAFAEGREATRAEIDESTRTGLPALLEVAELQGDAAIKELLAAMTTFAKTLDAFVA